MRSSKPPDAKLIHLFLDMLAAEQGAGANTLDAYRRDLSDFSEFLARAGKSFAHVETEGLRDYLADLDARGFKSSSVARRLSAMRHLFRFLLNEKIRGDDPAAILSGAKRRKPHRSSGFARRDYIACSRCSMPPVCGYRNWWRCRFRPRGATLA